MEVILKYFPLLGIILNTVGVIMLALFSMPKEILYKDGTEAYAINPNPERVEYMKSKYTKHRILTLAGYFLLFIGITIQAIPTAIDAF